jgi:methylenetetrahydrofolate reductase (NADPH)
LPADLSNEILKCKTDDEVEKLGQEWLLAQSRDLKKNGVPVLHYYTLGRPHVVANVVRDL